MSISEDRPKVKEKRSRRARNRAVSSPILVASDDASSLPSGWLSPSLEPTPMEQPSTMSPLDPPLEPPLEPLLEPPLESPMELLLLLPPLHPLRVVKEGSDAVLAQLAGVDQTVRSAVLRAGMAPEAAIAVLEATARLGELVTALVVRNAVLETKVALCQPAAAPPLRPQVRVVLAPELSPALPRLPHLEMLLQPRSPWKRGRLW
ncbi:uncharacterized protein LOC127566306 [Drosophila albomicans]|uniref:Uncharacterized protein LOC127566306 n=1 Tax=Drosophila albomicans TaxID=7291 RepID=A0A9C6WJ56_DROAB|nr:uncharacterized protein LOC127566306 [Drosophila albomicans]